MRSCLFTVCVTLGQLLLHATQGKSVVRYYSVVASSPRVTLIALSDEFYDVGSDAYCDTVAP